MDSNSRVNQLKREPRDYAVLKFLDTRPRLTYLARIRNPNPRMPDYHEVPLTVQDYIKDRHSSPFEEHGKAPAGPAKGSHGPAQPERGH
jgi:molybdopterin-containing oxidoreductase family iron-sulfur binding subunit